MPGRNTICEYDIVGVSLGPLSDIIPPSFQNQTRHRPILTLQASHQPIHFIANDKHY